MKINQIITENKKVNEAPAGALTQLGRSLGSKFLNKVGAKSMAQNMAGKADLGATANKLHQQYSRFLGVRNKNVNTATGQDLKDFLATKNVTVNVPSGRIDPARLDKMLLKVARDAMTNKAQRSANPAPTGAPPANPAPSGTGTPPASTKPGRVTLAQVKPMVSGLRPRDKQSLLKSLQKELGVSANPSPANPAPANPAPTGAPPAPPAPKRTRKRSVPPASP